LSGLNKAGDAELADLESIGSKQGIQHKSFVVIPSDDFCEIENPEGKQP
jgi:hypothetical protein